MPSASETYARLLRKAQADKRIPSVSAAALRGKEAVWSEAIGLAEAETGEEATPEHQYRIGSITKTFTAVSVMQLRDAGALSLDDPLGAHLTDAPRGEPTLRRLLSHTSGLQREPVGEIWESMVDHDEEEVVARLAEAEQVLAPGERFHYSNLAFALLGRVVERVSSTPYRRYVEERILGPLGLGRTTWEPTAPHAQGYYVHPYADTLERQPNLELRGSASAAQLWSTTADLARWAVFLTDPDPEVLAPATAEEMRLPQTIADPDAWTRAMGLGPELFRRGERVYVGHGGAMPGFLAMISYAPKAKAGAVVLTNTGAGFNPRELCLALAEKAAEDEPPAEPWGPGEPAPAGVAELLGRWWAEGDEWTFRWRSGRLEALPGGAGREVEPAVFEREADDRFRSVSGFERGELLRVVRAADGSVEKLYWATYPFTRDPRGF